MTVAPGTMVVASTGKDEPIPEQDHEVSSRLEIEEASATGEGNHPSTAASNRERDEVGSDDEQESDEKKGAEGAEGSSTRLPLSGVVAAVQRMDVVGRLTVLHDDLGELDSGHTSCYSQRRKLTVANDDYANLNENNLGYVRRVYTAITTTPAAMDDEQTKVSHDIFTLFQDRWLARTQMEAVLSKKITTFGNDADQYLADISSMVVGAVYHLYSEGDFLFGPQFEVLKPRSSDSTMTATERIDVICDALLNCKKFVVDLMEGSDVITRFVAAPLGAGDRKARYSASNTRRAAKTKEMKQAKMGAGNDAEGGANEQCLSLTDNRSDPRVIRDCRTVLTATADEIGYNKSSVFFIHDWPLVEAVESLPLQAMHYSTLKLLMRYRRMVSSADPTLY